jgi:hypothetical protein
LTVTYHAGRRIQATQADFAGTPAVSGGWKEVARTTLSSGSHTIDVSSIPDKSYYMVLTNVLGFSSAADVYGTFNNDASNNYAIRRSTEGGSESLSVNQPRYLIAWSPNQTTAHFAINKISSISGQEKLIINHDAYQSTAGSGTAPSRTESVSKWVNTSDAITSIKSTAGGSTQQFNSGSEVVVLGWDPDDTHTDNFWEQLASVELSSAGDDLSSGTISAKKYLWVQVYAKATGGNINNGFRFNSDTGSNYSNRRSVDGATDATQLNTSSACDDANLDSAYKRFYNMFIVNNSSNEKLCICNVVQQNASGAGNAPRRGEFVGKWANTSNQITDITLHNFSGGNLDAGSFIKVWGHD